MTMPIELTTEAVVSTIVVKYRDGTLIVEIVICFLLQVQILKFGHNWPVVENTGAIRT